MNQDSGRISGNRKNLRSDIWRESVTEEVSEELAFHVEMRAREIAAKRGIGIEEARRIAVSRFGDIRQVQTVCEDIGGRRDRDMKRNTFISELAQDIHYAFRQMRSAPAFSLLVILTLALGIGASTTIFSAVNAVVLRPFSFANADRVVALTETWNGSEGDVSAGSFTDWTTQATHFDAIAAIDWSNVVLTAGDTPDRVLGAEVSQDYFKVFATQPAKGRLFTADDVIPGAPRVVVLSWNTYEKRFAASPDVIGSDVIVNGGSARIIGVLPRGYDPMLNSEALYMPLSLTSQQIAERGSHYLDVFGLIKPGVTDANLRQQLTQITQQARARFPADYEGRGIATTPIRKLVLGDYAKRLYLLLGAVSVVLLIACANVANLLLARGAARQKEIAVRGALGAGRTRILRQLLTENLVLSLATVVVSLAVTWVGIRVLVRLAPDIMPRITEMRIDATVLGFAIAAGVASSLIFGLAPALRVSRQDLQSTLRSGGREGQGVVRDLLRSTLVAAEVALSVLLLIGAGLLIRTGVKAGRVDTGFRVDGVAIARVSLPSEAYSDPQRVLAAFQGIVDNTAAKPGVAYAAASSLAPLSAGGNEMFLDREGMAPTPENRIVARLRVITPGYFDAISVRVQRGRAFDARDVRNTTLVAIISQELANKLWPGEDPIGRRFACCEGDDQNPSYKTVIGVAPDLRSKGPTEAPDNEFYIPMMQAPPDAWNWLGRSMTIVAAGPTDRAASSQGLVDAIRAGVRQIDPAVPVYSARTIRAALDAATAGARFNTMLLTTLGLIGLLLAAIGIYGVVSYFVNLRTREIGVRMALGATTGSVLRLMARQAMVPVVTGMALGSLAALAAARLLTASLFGVTPTDPVTFAAVLGTLFVIALLAILVPARRASRVPPSEALLG